MFNILQYQMSKMGHDLGRDKNVADKHDSEDVIIVHILW